MLMPNLDGFEVRRAAAANRTPVLILTARDSEEDTIGAWTGADEYLEAVRARRVAGHACALPRDASAGEDAPPGFGARSTGRREKPHGVALRVDADGYALLELFMRNPRQCRRVS